jgi:hypothetical protein
MNRTLARFIAIGGLLAGTVLAAPPAQAISGCTLSTPSDKSGEAICSYGPGQVRVNVGCITWYGWKYVAQGAWVGPNRVSRATCGATDQAWIDRGNRVIYMEQTS